MKINQNLKSKNKMFILFYNLIILDFKRFKNYSND